MGVCCSRPSVAGEEIDIRARYSLDSPRNHHHADAASAGDTVLSVLQRGRLGGASAPPGSTLSRSGSSMSRLQGKHLRASSLGSSAGALYQLQLLPQGALLQQQQQQQQQQHAAVTLMHPALLAASSADQQGQQQHRHHHQQQQQQLQHAHAALVQHHLLPPVPSTRAGSRHAAVAAGGLQHPAPASSLSRTPPDALSPECVLSLCAALLEEEPELAAGGIHPLLLAGLCLIESGGRPGARQHREHVGGVALGLCQMLLSTAQWLASCRGFDRFSSSPSAADLQSPKCCLYFAAAYLSTLSQHDGSPRSESFLVRAYHSGPKGVDSQAAAVYWQKFLKAKHCLTEVASAMCVTLATAAAAAGLQLQPPLQQQQQPAGAAGDAGAVAAVAAAVTAYAEEGDELPDCAPVQDLCSSKQHAGLGAAQLAGGKASRHRHYSSSSHGGGGDSKQQQLSLPQAAAGLVAVLACSWEGHDVPPGCPGHPGEAAAAAAAGAGAAPVVSLGAGPAASHGSALISHMLPGLWHSPNTHNKAGQQQQQQQQQQQGVSGVPVGSSGSGTSRRRRSGLLGGAGGSASNNNSSSNGSSSGSPAGVPPLVPVSRASAEAALQRLSGISPLLLSAALSNADAAVAVAASVARAPSLRGAASFAAATTSSSQRHKAGARPPPGSSSGSSSDSGLAAWPCVMHVVGHSESLTHIAQVCGVAVADILAANPELPGPGGVQAHDCIALPLPVVPPRLYVVQCGDSLHSIAKAHRVPLGRLLAKNPELSDPSRVQPGWVVALPGLKGDSKTGTPLGWLLEAAAAAEAEASAAAAEVNAAAAAAAAEDAAVLAEEAELEQGQQQQQGPCCQQQVVGGARLPAWQPAALGSPDQQQQQLVSPFTAASQQQQQHRAAPATSSSSGSDRLASQGSALPAFGSGAFMFAVDSAARQQQQQQQQSLVQAGASDGRGARSARHRSTSSGLL